MDLDRELPRLLPKAIDWAKKQESLGRKSGAPIKGKLFEAARQVDVRRPDLIRLVTPSRLPQPNDPYLQEAARQTGLFGPGIIGLTLGYSIFILRGHASLRIVSHECRHVHQYERYGSIGDFLSSYLAQIIDHGYRDAPLEIDARKHEIRCL